MRLVFRENRFRNTNRCFSFFHGNLTRTKSCFGEMRSDSTRTTEKIFMKSSHKPASAGSPQKRAKIDERNGLVERVDYCGRINPSVINTARPRSAYLPRRFSFSSFHRLELSFAVLSVSGRHCLRRAALSICTRVLWKSRRRQFFIATAMLN